MFDCRRPTLSWRAILPFTLAGFLVSPGIPSRTQRGAPGACAAARGAPVPHPGVREAVLDGTDGLRDELRREVVGGAPRVPGRGREGRTGLAGGRCLPPNTAVGTADGVLLSRMSDTLARFKGGDLT